MHGGGWVVGSAGLNDRINADLAAEAGLMVMSVDYRLLHEARGVQMEHAIADCATSSHDASVPRPRHAPSRHWLT